MSPLRVRATRRFRLTLPGETAIDIFATVVWSSGNTSGLAFSELNVQQRERIVRWLNAANRPLVTPPTKALAAASSSAPAANASAAEFNVAASAEVESLLARACRVSHADCVFVARRSGATWVCAGSLDKGPRLGASIPDHQHLCDRACRTGNLLHCNDADLCFGAASGIVLPFAPTAVLVCVWNNKAAAGDVNESVLSIIGQLLSFVLGAGADNRPPVLLAAKSPSAEPAALETTPAVVPITPETPRPHKRRAHFLPIVATLLVALALVSGWLAGKHWTEWRSFALAYVSMPAPPPTIVQHALQPEPVVPVLQKPEPQPEAQPVVPAAVSVKPASHLQSAARKSPPAKTAAARSSSQVHGVAAYITPEPRTQQSATDSTDPSAPDPPVATSVPSTTDHPPILLRSVPPLYPASARAAKIRGQVVLRFTITATGNVADISSVNGDPRLVDAAKNAVRYWKYKPAEANGQPIETPATVAFDFNITSSD